MNFFAEAYMVFHGVQRNLSPRGEEQKHRRSIEAKQWGSEQ
jgi:hypothetical protein